MKTSLFFYSYDIEFWVTHFTGKDRAWTGDYTNAEYELVSDWDSVKKDTPSAALKNGDTDLLSGVSYYIVNSEQLPRS